MTLADNLAHDVVAVLNQTEFAGGVTYHPAGGSDVSTVGDFQEDLPQEIDEGRGRRLRRTGTLTIGVKVPPIDAPIVVVIAVARDDEFTIDGARWSVVTAFKEAGAWTIQLQRSEAIERSAGRVVAPRL